jgi:apolipoprotein N-acyltransferase
VIVAARDRLAAALGRSGWRGRAAVAAALGLAATLALPPYHAVILLVPAFAGLVLLVETAADRRAAFAAGWWFGAAHFATGLYWIGHALLVDAERFAWMIPFAIGGLGAGLGLFAGAAALAAQALGRSAGIALPPALGAAWFASAWLRGHVLTGFP